MRGMTHIVTYRPDGSNPYSLSHLGHMSPVKYSYVTPGGCDQLSGTFTSTIRRRTEAFNPGRLVQAYRGGAVVWSGILDEPSPSDAGWNLTAHGTSGWGTDYRAIYSVAWGTGVFNDAIDQAIGRGLGWVRETNIGAVSGIWTGQAVDSAAQTITDLLNLGCTKGGLTWTVRCVGDYNVLSVYALPTTPNRLLISTAPVGQSIASGPNKLWLRYQTSTDTSKAKAAYALASAVNQAAADKQGTREDFTDISSAGVQTSGSAGAVGNSVLQRFTRAGFTDAFTVNPGALTNMGGTPVDLGTFWSDGITAMVCKVLLSDFAFGGEVQKGPITFMVGAYEWDDAARVATITPFESMKHNFSSLLQSAVDGIPALHRHHATSKKKKGK